MGRAGFPISGFASLEALFELSSGFGVSQGTLPVSGKGQYQEKAVSHSGAPDMTGGKRRIEESRVMLLIGFL